MSNIIDTTFTILSILSIIYLLFVMWIGLPKKVDQWLLNKIKVSK